MTLHEPWLLALTALVPLAVAMSLRAAGKRAAAASRYAPGGPRPPTSGARPLRLALTCAAVALLAIAAARPTIGSRQETAPQQGIEVVLALDVSRSMLTADVPPDRLGLAIRELGALLDRLAGSRVALVLFADNGLLRAPLTTDIEAVRTLLASAQSDAPALTPGSNLAAGVRSSVRALEAAVSDSRAIVLVSDGEDHVGNAVDAAREAARQGIVVHVAGVGTERGGPVLERDPETGAVVPRVDPATGGPVVSRLDEANLRAIAEAGGGRYVPLAESGVEPIAEALAGLRAVRFEDVTAERPIERFQLFALAALVLLAAERLLAAGLLQGRLLARGALPAVALLAMMTGAACSADADDHNDSGNRYYAQERYSDALREYRRAQAADAGAPAPVFNAGVALYQLGEYERAAAELRSVLTTADPALRARAWYNLGNAYVRLGRLLDARAAYREALLLDPGDRDAKFNLELVNRALLEQPTAAQPPSEGAPPGQPAGEDATGAGDAGEASPGSPSGEGTSGEGEPQPGGDVDRALEEALAGIEREFTLEDALRVLDLLRERQAQGAIGGARSRTDGGPDY
ncbi:MAG TPA: tetratricopeptide repeat protein [Dehalococcoidia bacterium]|nr:tetratricopeptide repeat protein [Dehalococcoidia bacterium]